MRYYTRKYHSFIFLISWWSGLPIYVGVQSAVTLLNTTQYYPNIIKYPNESISNMTKIQKVLDWNLIKSWFKSIR